MARNRGKKISKNLSIIRSQKLLDQRKQPATDALKTASKSAIHKTAEASDSFIDNKTAERFRKVSKTSLQNKEEIVKLIRWCSKSRIEINDKPQGIYNAKSDIKFKASIIRPSLCDYSDAQIHF